MSTTQSIIKQIKWTLGMFLLFLLLCLIVISIADDKVISTEIVTNKRVVTDTPSMYYYREYGCNIERQ